MYLAHLSHPGEKLDYNEKGFPKESSYADESTILTHALRRVAHWKAERTFKGGQGTDHVSIWKHA